MGGYLLASAAFVVAGSALILAFHQRIILDDFIAESRLRRDEVYRAAFEDEDEDEEDE